MRYFNGCNSNCFNHATINVECSNFARVGKNHDLKKYKKIKFFYLSTLHRIEVLEPVTVKSIVEELNKLNKRIKHYICFCLL